MTAGKYGYRVNINRDAAAGEAYQRFVRALGLPYFAPPSDTQRLAFDTVYGDEGYDFEAFLTLAASGAGMGSCVAGSRKDKGNGG